MALCCMYDINKYIFGTKDFSFFTWWTAPMWFNMPSVLEISSCTHAQAAESTTRHDPVHDYEHHLSLPRSGGESDDISLPPSVMRMCLIMMLNLLLPFPRFCFCLFWHKQHNSLEPFPNAHTRSRPTSIGDWGDKQQPVSARNILPVEARPFVDASALASCASYEALPRMKRFAFDVASCSR